MSLANRADLIDIGSKNLTNEENVSGVVYTLYAILHSVTQLHFTPSVEN